MTLDPSALDSYREFMGEDAEAFIADIIQSFLEAGPQLVQTAEQALQAGEQEAFVRAVHTLKSNSATLGATQLSALAAEMERKGKSEGLVGLESGLIEAKAELVRVIEALKNLPE
ncbi:MAG: hypothetical protein Fur0043_20770 [Anaerolineales bacterium]